MPGGESSVNVQRNVDRGSLYSPAVGLVYLFNLIVGTGALTMPKAFAAAGWLVSLILVVFLSAVSYVTATFVIEAMSSANGMKRWMKLQQQSSRKRDRQMTDAADAVANVDERDGDVGDDDERKPLLASSASSRAEGEEVEGRSADFSDLFDITEAMEMGQMASMFFSKVGTYLFYASIVLYLFGDLAIYAAAVPKSLRDVVCTYVDLSFNGTSCVQNLTEGDLCWNTSGLKRADVYRIFVAAFAVLLGPFVYFNLQKTKYMQVVTTLLRWISFLIMIILAVIQLAKGKGQGHPPVVEVSGIPNLFGVCVYASMCHHSLPQMVTPIRNKSGIFRLFAADYFLILVFYCLLSFTGIFCFGQLYDLYTLNFRPNRCYEDVDSVTNVVFIQYFLALFPVFTLSTSFPIIAITLCKNLKVLFQRHASRSWAVDRLFFPTLTLVVPIAIALGTNNVQVLVGITGSYAGAGIQYIIPASLVLLSRREVASTVGDLSGNEFRSPFKHVAWIVLIFVWAAVCIALVTADHIINGFSAS